MKRGCKKIKKLLPLYADGYLEPKEEATVKKHLVECNACKQEQEALIKAWELTGTLPGIEPSADFKPRLWKRLGKQTESAGWFGFPQLVPLGAGILAAYLVGITLGYTFLRPNPPEERLSLPATEQSLAIFTGTYPENSIEAIALRKLGRNL